MLTVGIMINECTPDSGPKRVIPGSHRGPVYDHHCNGIFAGAIAEIALTPLLPLAVDATGPANSMTIRHVRTLHASGNCTADTCRPLLLFSYAAVDAFPVFRACELREFDRRILRNSPVLAPLPIRLPLPRMTGADSIYDNQSVIRS